MIFDFGWDNGSCYLCEEIWIVEFVVLVIFYLVGKVFDCGVDCVGFYCGVEIFCFMIVGWGWCVIVCVIGDDLVGIGVYIGVVYFDRCEDVFFYLSCEGCLGDVFDYNWE